MTPEGRVKAKVKRALATLPFKYAFMPVQQGLGAPALDFFCCISGKFVAIETKAKGTDLTERQCSTAEAITDAGGFVFVINSDNITSVFAQIRSLCQ